METVVLEAQNRSERGSSASCKLRRQGLLPATVYGLGQDPVAITIPAKDLVVLLRSAHSANVLVDLKIPGLSHELSVAAMIREIQRHPVRREPLHVDFFFSKPRQVQLGRLPVPVYPGNGVGVPN